jgi:hypothetical protein
MVYHRTRITDDRPPEAETLSTGSGLDGRSEPPVSGTGARASEKPRQVGAFTGGEREWKDSNLQPPVS